MYTPSKCALLGLMYFVLPSFCAANYPQMFIDLANDPPGKTITMYRNLTDPQYSINVINISVDVSFFVLQVHTFIEKVTLSYENPLDTHSFTTGTNIGLVWKADLERNISEIVEFYLFRDQDLSGELDIMLIINTYSKDDPIPGGCNLSFETEIAPYQKINETDELIIVMSQPPSLFGEFCNKSGIITEMYYLYLTEHDNSSEDYFMGIQQMVTVENITKYGTKVPNGLAHNKFKQMYNKYSGTGRIFAVVSSYEGRNSAYVPAVSYGCNINMWEEECIGPVGIHWKLALALLLICGYVISLSGYRFFRTGLFIVGYIFGVIVMLVVVTADNDFTAEGKAIYSLIMGIFFAVTWVFLWWKFGIPLVAVVLAFLLDGLLIASILFYTQLGDIFIFADELTFWTSVAIVLVICQVPLLCLKPLFYIIALSLLGSYAVTVAMNYYVGGNLAYILINTYRRMTVKNFGIAVIDPPYQFVDFAQTLQWVLLFGVGIYVQYKYSRGRPPFPPHRSVQVIPLSERTPLLQEEQPPAYRAS